jgi:signal transduction histidine kinase
VVRERLRIARDLHDTLAHSLMALLTQVRLIRKLRDRLPGDELDAELARAEEAASAGLSGARQAIGQMRRGGARDNGLGPALQDLVQRFAERTGQTPLLQMQGVAADCAGEVGEAAYRVAEEALRNIERHAQASAVQIELSSTNANADDPVVPAAEAVWGRLRIVDNGRGFDPRQPSPGHFGLAGMQEQAALIGGRWQVNSAPGQGTCISLSFPL